MTDAHYQFDESMSLHVQTINNRKSSIFFHENYVCIKTKSSKFLQQGFSYLSLLNGDIEVNYSSKTAKIKVLQGKKTLLCI
jgi:hypothetical protein